MLSLGGKRGGLVGRNQIDSPLAHELRRGDPGSDSRNLRYHGFEQRQSEPLDLLGGEQKQVGSAHGTSNIERSEPIQIAIRLQNLFFRVAQRKQRNTQQTTRLALLPQLAYRFETCRDSFPAAFEDPTHSDPGDSPGAHTKRRSKDGIQRGGHSIDISAESLPEKRP